MTVLEPLDLATLELTLPQHLWHVTHKVFFCSNQLELGFLSLAAKRTMTKTLSSECIWIFWCFEPVNSNFNTLYWVINDASLGTLKQLQAYKGPQGDLWGSGQLTSTRAVVVISVKLPRTQMIKVNCIWNANIFEEKSHLTGLSIVTPN